MCTPFRECKYYIPSALYSNIVISMAASVAGKVKVPLALELFGNFSSSGRPVLAKEVLERFRTEQEQEESGKLASTDKEESGKLASTDKEESSKLASTDKEEASEAEPTSTSNKDEADGEQVG
jgi:hypothetical protein